MTDPINPPPYGANPQFGGGLPGPEPDNYLVWSILVTIFCCLPFGIVAIVKSTSVGKLWAQGNAAGARAAADSAKTWVITSAAVGIVVIILSFIANMAVA